MLQMTPARMRELAHHVVEILIERSVRLPSERVWEGDFKDALVHQLVEDPPETGRPPREVIDRAAQDVLNNTLRLDHPRSFGFVPTCPTWPGVLADFMASGFNVNVPTWLVASGPSQIEEVVIGWFRKWFGLPKGAGGLMTSGGASGALHALVAAREAAGNPERPVVYMSDESHSVQLRAARIVGITPDRIRVLPADTSGRIDPGELAEAVAADRSSGCTPMVVCANAGTPSRAAVDPLPALRSRESIGRTRSASTRTSCCSSRTRPVASWFAMSVPLNVPSRFGTTCCRIPCGAPSTPTWRTTASN